MRHFKTLDGIVHRERLDRESHDHQHTDCAKCVMLARHPAVFRQDEGTVVQEPVTCMECIGA